MKTPRTPLALVIVALGALILPPAPASSQTPDWTLDVPVQLTSLDPQVRYVVVSCFVGPQEVGGFYMHNHWVGTADQGIEEWEGVNLPPFAAGVAWVEPDASGSVQTQLSVPIYAPPGMDVAQKIAATTWSCGLALSPDPMEPMFRTIPDPNHEHAFARPAPGSSYVGVVSGTFN